MKKKLLCLVMSILMLLPCALTGCNLEDKTEDEIATGNKTDNSAKTITMWVMTPDYATEEEKAEAETAQKLVSEAFTKITKSLYKTNVVLKFCQEKEYYEKLESCILAKQEFEKLKEEADKALRQYKRAHKGEKPALELEADFYAENPQYAQFQNTVDEEDETTEEETQVNDYGIVEIKYPEEKENQVDIFYISGYERYMSYYAKEWLASLSEELSSGSRKLMAYISPSLLNGVQIEGSVYAIPNNVPIGEYTYMMIDKDLFDTYYNKIEDVSTVLDLATFLSDMKNYNAANGLTADDEGYVVPLASTFKECMDMLVWYWDLDYRDLSVYETYYDETRNRTYAVGLEYVAASADEEETTASGGATKEPEKRTVLKVVPDVVYKSDAEGHFLDKDGNVLNYHYERDTDGGWVEKSGKLTYDNKFVKGVYLVDENGDAVTAENDRRVVLTNLSDGEDAQGQPLPVPYGDYLTLYDATVATTVDADGNPRPTYYYEYKEGSEFSALGTVMLDPAKRSRGSINLNFDKLIEKEDFRKLYTTLTSYSFEQYYGEPKENQLAGVSFMKGDSRVKLAYEENGVYVNPENGREYYVVVAEYPEAGEQELYGNMYAVYANSSYLSRSMEIITRLNTNADLRNLLQYGILGEHYELNDDGTVHLLTSDADKYGTYRMDIAKTGNCFIAAPPETEGYGPDAWTYAKVQNNESLINPLLGFDFNTRMKDNQYDLDVMLIDVIHSLSADAYADMLDCENIADLQECLSTILPERFKKQKGLNAEKWSKAINGAYDPSMPQGPEVKDAAPDLSGANPFTIYNAWLTEFGYNAKTATKD